MIIDDYRLGVLVRNRSVTAGRSRRKVFTDNLLIDRPIDAGRKSGAKVRRRICGFEMELGRARSLRVNVL
jgi:hypothetical protein